MITATCQGAPVMIAMASGRDVLRMLDRIAEGIGRYHQLTICSPFVDERMLDRLEHLISRSERARAHLLIVTTPAMLPTRLTAAALRARGSVRIAQLAALHAKFYLAIGRDFASTEAIVTSANLTVAGTSTNIELGFRITASTEADARILKELDRYSRRLVA